MTAAIDQRAWRRMRFMVALVAVLTSVVPGGCATPKASGHDLTGGVSLRMLIKAEGNSFTLYRVATDGTLSFGGGADAASDQTSWTGDMTGDELRQLLDLLDRSGWWSAAPASSAAGADAPRRTYQIRLDGPRGRRNFKLAAAGPDVLALEELLASAARRRNDEFLERLPKPGQQP